MAWPSIQSAFHQLNPFDGGRTYDTDQRGVTPGTPRTSGPQVGDQRFESPTGNTLMWDGQNWQVVGNSLPGRNDTGNNDQNTTSDYGNQVGSSGGGGGAASSFKDTSAARSATQSSIDALGAEQETGLNNIQTKYNELTGGYNREAERVKDDYDEGVVDNNNALSRNKQNALLAAAQGRRGLRSTLSSLGALSGDGSFLADQAVSNAANQDIGGATETFATNASSLDDAYDEFEEDNLERMEAAKAERTTQRRAEKGRIAAKRQGYYQKMAELFSDGGDEANAAKYLGMTEPLNDVISRSAGITPSGFQPGKAAFTPGSLESYLAGAGDMTVNVAGGEGAGGVPSLRYGNFGRSRDREEF